MNAGIERKVVILETIDSTNAYALDKAGEENWPEGSIVMAEFQEKGRGQRGNTWYSSPGKNLLCSIVVYPEFLPLTHQHFLGFCISLAIRDALADIPLEANIKWPNDILVQGRKIAGTLIQNSIKGRKMNMSVVGFGLNVNEIHFPAEVSGATSILLETGREMTPGRILSKVLGAWDHYYGILRAGAYQKLKDTYLEYLHGLHQNLIYRTSDGKVFTGQIQGIDDRGRICVSSDGEDVVQYDIKDIVWVREEEE